MCARVRVHKNTRGAGQEEEGGRQQQSWREVDTEKLGEEKEQRKPLDRRRFRRWKWSLKRKTCQGSSPLGKPLPNFIKRPGLHTIPQGEKWPERILGFDTLPLGQLTRASGLSTQIYSFRSAFLTDLWPSSGLGTVRLLRPRCQKDELRSSALQESPSW